MKIRTIKKLPIWELFYESNKAFIKVFMPLKIRKIAPPQAIIPKISTAIYKGCSLLLKALYKIEGPKKISGIAPAKYLKPLNSTSLLVLFIC